MALVAYSDESDFSGSENEEELNSDKSLPISKLSIHQSDIDKKIPSKTVTYPGNQLDVDVSITDNVDVNATDILDDVPTLKTWHIKPVNNGSEIQGKVADNKLNSKKDKNFKPSKLKLVLPALSEFDDEDLEEEEVPVRKKLKPSDGGTGLFAVLPKPRGPTSLVPLHVSRPPKQIKQRPVKQKKTSKPINNKPDSGEEDLSDSEVSDFFSLSSEPALDSTLPNLPSVVSPALDIPDPNIGIRCNLTSSIMSPTVQEPSALQPSLGERETISQSETFIPFKLESEVHHSSASNSNKIEEEALLRLAGRRNKGQVPDFIDIKADDALMSREEWVTRAICDEKPKKSFSKKKEGNPTQQQKRKHQITYLAHQAQEREQELQNSWGQNRFTKMQTQSRYGF